MQLKIIAAACASLAMIGVAEAKIATCSTMKSAGISTYDSKLNGHFIKESLDYWSMGCAGLKPDCILEPSSAAEVAEILKVLQTNNDQFAVKSGGHNPNNYWASTDGGALISMRNMNEVTYDKDRGVVHVGPGQRWDDVFKGLQGTGMAVVGGRMGNVGVGGFLLGGGLSFLSTQEGWAANNILEYELVTANGTIMTASATQNKETFDVLRGGGNNFGIVTRFTLKARPIGQVWGGNMIFGKEKTDQILAAVRNFTEHYDDPKAAIIATVQLTVLDAVEMWTLFLFYDGPTPPAGVFDAFKAAGPTINNCKSREYDELLSFNNWAVLHGSRYVIATETTPLPSQQHGAQVMRAYFDQWRSVAAKNKGEFGIISSMALQPMPKSVARIARERGGDMLDLDDAADRIIFEFNYSYLFGTSDKAIDAATMELTGGIKSLVDGFVANGTLQDAFRPLFLNDVYHKQDYWSRLRPEKRQAAVNARKALDPGALFGTRTGGLKP